MPYIVPVQPLTSRRLRGMRGLRGLGDILGPAISATTPPLPAPPGLPPGWDTGYPTVATPPVAIFSPSPAPAPSSLVAIPSALPGPSAASATGMAVGTLLTYQAQVSATGANLVPFISKSLATLTSDVGAALQSKWGIVLTGSKLPGLNVGLPGEQGTVTFTVYLNQPYGQPLDVKSIIDGEINAIYGWQLLSSSIAISGNALGGAVGTPQTPSWISQNWPWLAGAGVAGLFLWKVL